LIRCDTDKTDIGNTEHLDTFIHRHGGADEVVEYLKESYCP
jgi:hypothetical protein